METIHIRKWVKLRLNMNYFVMGSNEEAAVIYFIDMNMSG